jgi:hypothetical protein
MFAQDSLDEAFDSADSEGATVERKSRWPSWLPIARPHWPR